MHVAYLSLSFYGNKRAILSHSCLSSLFISLANPYVLNDDTSLAEEVEKYNEENVYFARSNKPRSPRPSSVTFNVGDVVRHTLDGYHGVIIGWDVDCKVINNDKY